jgi:hypothetical protein
MLFTFNKYILPCRPLTAILYSAVLCLPTVAQNAPSLRIAFPSDGAIVRPGERLTITVVSPSGTAFTAIGVIGEGPFGVAAVQSSLPADVLFNLPADMSCRKYALTASGVTASGAGVDSPTIQVDVERADLPISLIALLPSLTFSEPGESLGLQIVGKFADGKVLDVTESTLVTYASSDSKRSHRGDVRQCDGCKRRSREGHSDL